MCKDYNDLNTKDKVKITKVLDLKHKIIDLTKEFNDYNAKVFDLVKSSNGITKGEDKINFIAKGEDTLVFDLDKFVKDYPKLYTKYLVSKEGAKEHLRYNLK